MRKSDLDRLLEVAVARALGVPLPRLRTATRARKVAHPHRPIKRAA